MFRAFHYHTNGNISQYHRTLRWQRAIIIQLVQNRDGQRAEDFVSHASKILPIVFFKKKRGRKGTSENHTQDIKKM